MENNSEKPGCWYQGDLRPSSCLSTDSYLPKQTSGANFVSQSIFSIGIPLYFLQ